MKRSPSSIPLNPASKVRKIGEGMKQEQAIYYKSWFKAPKKEKKWSKHSKSMWEHKVSQKGHKLCIVDGS